MQISKILLASLLGAVVINNVMADEYDGPRNRCKSKSDKIWVESTKECIPANPCKDSTYDTYCNRMFKDFEVKGIGGEWKNESGDGYKLLVAAYALGHDLSCKPLDAESKTIGQDYVMCYGDDVMVFEFDDINDINVKASFSKEAREKYNDEYSRLFCEALGGGYNTEYAVCTGISEERCVAADRLAFKYKNLGQGSWTVNLDPAGCVINFVTK